MPSSAAAQTVSIIIAAHNAATMIARAVRSALAEPEVAEVIVVDDASTDDTAGTAGAADDGSSRLKILTQPCNAGPSAARNRAIRESISPWIGVLDADDFFLPGRIAQLLTFSNTADLIADDAGQVDENAVTGPRKNLIGSIFEKPQLINLSKFVLADVTGIKNQNRGLGFIKPLIRRSFIDIHQIRYQENMRLGEDYELYARALALGARLCITPEQGYVSVVRENSLSGRHSEDDLRNFRDCDISLAMLPNLKPEDKFALRKHYLSVDCRLQWRLLINAVKQKDIKAAVATFMRPWPVSVYLCGQLWKEFRIRLSKKMGHIWQ